MCVCVGDEKTIDRNVYLNSTLSVQVVAPKLQERRLVQAMKLIDEVVRGKDNGLARL
jgi:amidase